MVALAFEPNIPQMLAALELRSEYPGNPWAQIFIQQQTAGH